MLKVCRNCFYPLATSFLSHSPANHMGFYLTFNGLNVSYQHGVDCVGCVYNGVIFRDAVSYVYVVHHISSINWKISWC